MHAPIVLFLGVRRGAIQAAHRMGLRIWAVTKNPVAPSLQRQIERLEILDFTKSTEGLSRLCHQWFAEGKPKAIIALTESAVVVAAVLRGEFQIQGHPLELARKFNDKLLMKQTMIAAGIPCASFRPILENTNMQELMEDLGLPMVVKQINNSGGRGMMTIRSRDDIKKNKYVGHLAEAFVSGVELSVESIIHDERIVFQNITEYFIPGWANILPHSLDAEMNQAISELNHRAIRALGIKDGITHLEMFMTNQGLVFGEIAVRPPGGYIMELIEKTYGFCPWHAFIQSQLGIEPEVQPVARRFSGALILHPGIGHVKEVIGIEAVSKIPHLTKLRCTVKPGDFVGPRLGTGQNKGYAVVCGETREQVAEALRIINREVRFVMV